MAESGWSTVYTVNNYCSIGVYLISAPFHSRDQNPWVRCSFAVGDIMPSLYLPGLLKHPIQMATPLRRVQEL